MTTRAQQLKELGKRNAEEREAAFFKQNPDGCTFAPWCNSGLMEEAYEAGHNSLAPLVLELAEEMDAYLSRHDTGITFEALDRSFLEALAHLDALLAEGKKG